MGQFNTDTDPTYENHQTQADFIRLLIRVLSSKEPKHQVGQFTSELLQAIYSLRITWPMVFNLFINNYTEGLIKTSTEILRNPENFAEINPALQILKRAQEKHKVSVQNRVEAGEVELDKSDDEVEIVDTATLEGLSKLIRLSSRDLSKNDLINKVSLTAITELDEEFEPCVSWILVEIFSKLSGEEAKKYLRMILSKRNLTEIPAEDKDPIVESFTSELSKPVGRGHFPVYVAALWRMGARDELLEVLLENLTRDFDPRNRKSTYMQRISLRAILCFDGIPLTDKERKVTGLPKHSAVKTRPDILRTGDSNAFPDDVPGIAETVVDKSSIESDIPDQLLDVPDSVLLAMAMNESSHLDNRKLAFYKFLNSYRNLLNPNVSKGIPRAVQTSILAPQAPSL